MNAVNAMNMIPGYSVWKENDSYTMSLTHYYSRNNRLCSFYALCPILSEKLVKDKILSDSEKFSFKKDFSLLWLEYKALPNLVKQSWNDNYLFDWDTRGYVRDYPDYNLVDYWPDTEEGLLVIYINSLSFDDILSCFLKIPPFLENLREKITRASDAFLSSDRVKCYLYKKAEEMADFWASKIQTLGTNGDPMSDILHTIVDSLDKTEITYSEIEKFKNSMIDHTLEQFGKRQIPFYNTDYGIGPELMEILKKSSLEGLSSKFPWKTWKHFDFNDALLFTVDHVT